MRELSLLSSLNRVEVPVIEVVIGKHRFGVFSRTKNTENSVEYSNFSTNVVYPNYIKSLQVKRVNGKFNTYTIGLIYPITERDDPNFFDKVFSSVSNTRKIIISCGDASAPSFMYRNDEALITKIQESIDVRNSIINYTITAVSSAYIMTGGVYTFRARHDKPSNVIKELLRTSAYGLTDIFTGMKDYNDVVIQKLIPTDDKEVEIEMMSNISVLEYLSYLVECMKPYQVISDSLSQGVFYTLTIMDGTTEVIKDEKNNYVFNGPYFKIERSIKDAEAFDTYTIDIGFPSKDAVVSFDISNSDNYTVLYDYCGEINEGKYVQRINNQGEFEQIYAPAISSNNNEYKTTEADKTWWTKVTQFPIKANITLKGLLRPALLMQYVRLNVYFYGKKYAYGSGLYIITEQNDNIDSTGYKTTLSLMRVAGEFSQDYTNSKTDEVRRTYGSLGKDSINYVKD